MRICFAVDDGPEIEEAFEFYYGRFLNSNLFKDMIWLVESISLKTGPRYNTWQSEWNYYLSYLEKCRSRNKSIAFGSMQNCCRSWRSAISIKLSLLPGQSKFQTFVWRQRTVLGSNSNNEVEEKTFKETSLNHFLKQEVMQVLLWRNIIPKS